MSNILIIDDDPAICELLSAVISRMDHTAISVLCGQEGLNRIHTLPFDLVLLDVHLPDGNGLEFLAQIRETINAPEVIIITGMGDPEAAELAIKSGAWDYLVKPSSVDDIKLTIRRALTYRHEKCVNASPFVLKRQDIIGNSPLLNAALARVAQAAAVESNVLISGETGTGKELMARAIHNNSSRAKHRFVVVDCAALPESLVESVLFGHTKGAFTSAEKDHEGLIQQADGGTLFLDEVGELPLSTQKSFLRVIQERCFRPVSAKREIQINFRLIAATNRDLDAMVDQGTFRNDLLFRLRSFNIEAPTLRQRKEDIKYLTIYYVNQLCHIYGSEIKGFADDFFEVLIQYQWPGNVRELFHALEEALSLAGGEPTLYPHHLPTRIRAAITRLSVKAHTAQTIEKKTITISELKRLTKDNFLSINHFRNQMERQYLERLTQVTNGNRKEACRIAGLSRTRLFELLKKHSLSGPSLKNKPDAGNEQVINH